LKNWRIQLLIATSSVVLGLLSITACQSNQSRFPKLEPQTPATGPTTTSFYLPSLLPEDGQGLIFRQTPTGNPISTKSFISETVNPEIPSYPIPTPSMKMAECKAEDLFLEVGTMYAPPQQAVIRVVLYKKRGADGAACHFKTMVYFRVENKSGKSIEISGNNGVAFSSGFMSGTEGSARTGVGAVWFWSNFCPDINNKEPIFVFGSAGGLQITNQAFPPQCLSPKMGSQIFLSGLTSNQETTEPRGTATPSP
jgi:hypothetical protein